MDLNTRKELFSIAYIRALSSQAGLNNGKYEVDDDSIDITLSKKGCTGTGAVYSPKLDIQLKCTAQDLTENETSFSCRLKIKNYNELRVVNSSSPRILVVLRVPSDHIDWIDIGSNDITLKHSAYWISLRNMPDVQAETTTIQIPKDNRLTTETLEKLFLRIGSGEMI